MNETTTETRSQAERFLDLLVERKLIELERGSDQGRLAAGISKELAAEADPKKRASRLAQWLLDQREVAELFASDDELAAALQTL
jgi:hypothetical protein